MLRRADGAQGVAAAAEFAERDGIVAAAGNRRVGRECECGAQHALPVAQGGRARQASRRHRPARRPHRLPRPPQQHPQPPRGVYFFYYFTNSTKKFWFLNFRSRRPTGRVPSRAGWSKSRAAIGTRTSTCRKSIRRTQDPKGPT